MEQRIDTGCPRAVRTFTSRTVVCQTARHALASKTAPPLELRVARRARISVRDRLAPRLADRLRRCRGADGRSFPESPGARAGDAAADHQSAQHGACVRRDGGKQSGPRQAAGAPGRDQQLVRRGHLDPNRHLCARDLRDLAARRAPRRWPARRRHRLAHAPPHRGRRRSARGGGGKGVRDVPRSDRPAQLLPDHLPADDRAGHDRGVHCARLADPDDAGPVSGRRDRGSGRSRASFRRAVSDLPELGQSARLARGDRNARADAADGVHPPLHRHPDHVERLGRAQRHQPLRYGGSRHPATSTHTRFVMRFLIPALLLLCAVPVADAQTIDRCSIRPGTACLSANLRGAALTKTDLTRADLSRSDLSGADLSEARLDRAKLQRVDLQRANLTQASLERASLRGANLSGATLVRASASAADLQGANLGGADLSNATLTGTSLRYARMGSAKLRGANLERADLTGADLRGADLAEANLQGARFEKANLDGADLTGAKLEKATFRGATVRSCTGCPKPGAQ